VNCDDGDACTANSCDPATGCTSTPVNCDDGDACTANFCDPATGCGSNPVVCDDMNECTANSCDPTLGCQHPNLADGTPCSIGECQAGVCTVVAEKRVFRMDTIVLTDPHVVLDKVINTPIFFSDCPICEDITNVGQQESCAGETVDLPGLNPALNDLITLDSDADGYIDLSFMLVYDPLDQTDGGGGLLTVTEGLCDVTDPTTCVPDPAASNTETTSYSTQAAGTCMSPITGTLGPRPYPDGITVEPNSPSGSCFVSDPTQFTITLEFELDGSVETVSIPMQQAQLAGEWGGDPATSITNGLLRGFLTMQEGDQQNFTFNIDLIGDVNFNLGRDLLPDGGNAHGCGGVARTFPTGGTSGSNAHCAGGDSRDLRDGGSGASYTNCGWWFYINYTGAWASNASGF
jgi:hypothetical protein